uniref:DUF4371 domain-containing protein n=1 Tax=Aegilops tauschii subsp. strangulata TaxID=200361 RepID=A0A453ISC7_AEGTS
RIAIADYDVNDQNRIRRGYIAKGACRPKKYAFPQHPVGEKYNFFIAPKTTIVESFSSTTKQDKVLYIARLTYSLKCPRFLLGQGLAFRGHDEREVSLNKGNFLELLHWLAENFEEVNKVVLKNAPKNNKMIAHEIQTDLINSCAKETTRLMMEELALCLRYVDKIGRVVERFLGILHVANTTSLTLKTAIESLLMEHGLTFSRVRGQGYDGASNMKGHVNGLKKLIMDESPSAYYVHCFAHQLQLSLVAVAKENRDCVLFFQQLANLLNVLGMSCKKIRMLRVAQAERIIKALELEEIETGKGMNQEMGLSRPGDTRWGSHHKTIMHILRMYPSIRLVLNKLVRDPTQSNEAMLAETMLTYFESFDFVFMAHLLQTIFGHTNDLSRALQKKDQDIVNAVELIHLTKIQLQLLRDDGGWETFLEEVTSYCVKHKVKVPQMGGKYKPPGRPSRFYKNLTNLHRFHVEMFLGLIDRQLR